MNSVREYTDYYRSAYFNLHLTQKKSQTKMIMKLNANTISTAELPNTISIIRKHFPSVLSTKCFNYNNFSFNKEIRNTEIGHLFEHILLENLCLLKLKAGAKEAVYNGRTDWNWKVDPRGVFYIYIDSGTKEYYLFEEALKKSIVLTEMILSSLSPCQLNKLN